MFLLDHRCLRLKGDRGSAHPVKHLQVRSNSPPLTPAANACHSVAVKVSTGPQRSLESRTATMPGRLLATSTQFPFPPLRELLRHTARDRSIAVIPRTFSHDQSSSCAAAWSISRDSFGPRAAACTNRNIPAYR